MEGRRSGRTNSLHAVQFGEVRAWCVSLSLICCVHFILCFNFAAASDVCSCQQYGRCNRCPLTDPCTRINVALAKPVVVSSVLNSTTEVSGPGCLAVNGHTTTISRFVNDSPACFATKYKDLSPYWEVDLGQNYVISAITVFAQSDARRKWLMNANITVDDVLCYTFALDYPDILNITCNSPLTGRKVRMQRRNRTDIEYLSLCQVQVWICNNGSYGPNCSKTCGNCIDGTTCNPTTGECSRGCTLGYNGLYCNDLCSTGSYGPNCSKTCSNCIEGTTCNPTTGECSSGCTPGYHGLYCNDRCSPRTYGRDCQEICGNCRLNTTCRQTDGRCEQGCAGDYTDNFCKTTDRESARGVNWTHLVAGAIIGGVALGAVAIGFLLGSWFTRCRQRQRQEEGYIADVFSMPLQTVFQNISVPPRAYGKLEVSNEDNEDPVYANCV